MRFTNEAGVVVSVSADAARRLGRAWWPVQAEPTPDDTWSVKQLRAYADERGIDLDGATKKQDILSRVG